MKVQRVAYVTLISIIFLAFAAFTAFADSSSDYEKQLAVEYVTQFESKLKTSTSPQARYFTLNRLTPAALVAGLPEKAEAYAKEILAIVPELHKDWRGDAIHTANIVLGWIALENGDVVKSKAHLLAAGQIESSMMFKAVGPEMRLAKRLIEKGERAATIKYFEACAVFWTFDRGQLAQWTATVNSGGVPNFNVNNGAVYDITRFAAMELARLSPANMKRFAAQYLTRHEQDLKNAANVYEQYRALYNLCPAALAAGEIETARKYAGILIEIAPQIDKSPGFGHSNRGAAMHISNIVLGQIALSENRIADAKKHLRAAGDINEGNPVLTSFGPNMLLAKLLIEKGERTAVVEYLDLCAKFWTSEKGRLAIWKDAIKAGGTPDFGTALINFTDGWLNSN